MSKESKGSSKPKRENQLKLPLHTESTSQETEGSSQPDLPLKTSRPSTFRNFLTPTPRGSQTDRTVSEQPDIIKTIINKIVDGQNVSKGLLNKISDINVKVEVDGIEKTILHTAVEYNNYNLIKYLLKRKGINVNIQNHLGKTPLHIAMERKDYELVESLLSHREIDINIRNRSGYTPFDGVSEEQAIIFKKIFDQKGIKSDIKVGLYGNVINVVTEPTVELMIHTLKKEFQSLNSVNQQNQFLDGVIADLIEGDVEREKMIVVIKTGAELIDSAEQRNNFLESAVSVIIENREIEEVNEVLKIGYGLIDSDVQKSKFLDNAISHITESNKLKDFLSVLEEKEEASNVRVEIVKKILKKHLGVNEVKELKADINRQDNLGRTPLHIAIQIGLPQGIIRQLLENGADVNIKDNMGYTALHHASTKSSVDVIKMILRNGADIEAKDSLGLSPLLLVSKARNTEKIIELLLENGANPNVRSKDGITSVFHYVSRFIDKQIVKPKIQDTIKLFIEYGAKISIDNKDRGGENKDLVEDITIKSKGFAGDVKQIASNQDNLFDAISKGNLEEVKSAIKSIKEKSFKINPKIKNKNGFTLVNFALSQKVINQEIINFLIDEGFDVSLPDHTSKQTPLHRVAIKKDLFDIANKILGKEINVNAKDVKGDIPIDLAAKNQHKELFTLLIEKGADVNYCMIKILKKSIKNHAAGSGNIKDIENNLQQGFELIDNIGEQNTFLDIAIDYMKSIGELEKLLSFLEKQQKDPKSNFKGIGLPTVHRLNMIYETVKDSNNIIDRISKLSSMSSYLDLMEKEAEEIREDFYAAAEEENTISSEDDQENLKLQGKRRGALPRVGFASQQDIEGEEQRQHAYKRGRRGAMGRRQSVLEEDINDILFSLAKSNRCDDQPFKLEMFKTRIEQNKDIDLAKKDHKGRTFLHYAAENGNLDIVDICVDKGLDVSKCFEVIDSDNKRPINLAWEKGHDKVEEFLESKMQGAEEEHQGNLGIIGRREDDKISHLDRDRRKAVGNVRSNSVLRRGSVIGVSNTFDKVTFAYGALLLSAQSESLDGVKSNLKLIPDLERRKIKQNLNNLVDRDNNQNILHYAVKGKSLDVINYLAEEFGLDVLKLSQFKDKQGKTPLDLAKESNPEIGLNSGLLSQLCYKIRNKETKNISDITKHLSERDILSNLSNQYREDFNLLHIIAESGGFLDKGGVVISDYSELVGKLVIGDHYIADKQGFTPADLAKINGQIPELTYFKRTEESMQAGSDNVLFDTKSLPIDDQLQQTIIKTKVNYICSALLNATKKGDIEYIKKIFIEGTKQESDESIKFIKENLSKIYNLEEKKTLLHFAAQEGRDDIMKIFKGNGVDLSEQKKDANGQTPLHLAVENGHKDIVNLLVQNGCDLNSPNKNGQTPLHLAAKNNHQDIVNLLVEKNCNINSSDKDGRTALHLAAMNGHQDIVDLLVENGANIDLRDKDGNTAYGLAFQNKHVLTGLGLYGDSWIDYFWSNNKEKDNVVSDTPKTSPRNPEVEQGLMGSIKNFFFGK